MRPSRRAAGCLAALWLLAGTAAAHEGHEKAAAEAAGRAPDSAAETAGEAPAAFPFEVGGPFALIDHTGRAVTERDFLGSYLLVFFGYAGCEAICPVGLKRMAEVLDLLGEDGARIQPLLITVDPERDTPEVLATRVAEGHPRLIGLTGTAAQLAAVAKAYNVGSKFVGTSWKGDPILSHGSYIYLMGPDGGFATLLPPVLPPDAMAKTIRNYL
ncbi:MAG: SCO family protein [Rhodospirillales bacterium]|nr:SCO family protein [Rhodospirillales bacterium]